MKNKALKKISAILAAGTLMVSMCSMTAFAAGVTGDGTTPISSITVEKTVLTDGDTFAPDTTFTFSVATGDAGTFDGNVVYAGVTGGLEGSAGAVFTPRESASASYTANGSLKVNADAFEDAGPGVYHYVVTESDVTYEGITKDSSAYDVYLYVYRNETTNTYYVGNVVSAKDGEKTNLAFINDYGKNNDTTHDVIVTKSVTGNQGDKNKGFDFKVSVNGGDNEKYKVVVKETAASEGVVSSVISKADPVTYTIKDGGSIQILGLSANDIYTVNENDYTSDGYKTTNRDNTGKLTADATSIEVTNHKDANTPTGIIASYAPYILMVVVAGAAVVLFLRRRNRAEF